MDIFDKFQDKLKVTLKDYKELSEEAISTAQNRMHEIPEGEQRNFLKESLQKAQTGELTQEEFLKGLKETQNAS